MFAYAPVMTGAWQQHEVWDGTYNYDDLLDWHEMNEVKQRNEKLIHEYQQSLQEVRQ
jgi:cytochrome c-type biogenesis protein CcmH/NrfG